MVLLIVLWLAPLWAARVTVREAPRVQIASQGILAGREVFVTRTQRCRQYLGIPFAHPPVGALRFAPPSTSPLPSWEEPRNSTYQPACLQDRDRFEDHDKLRLETKLFPDDRIEFNEDCLYLNVFCPDGAVPNEGWPVLIWFHSGDFLVGAPHLWDASVFAVKQKIGGRVQLLAEQVIAEGALYSYGTSKARVEGYTGSVSGVPDQVYQPKVSPEIVTAVGGQATNATLVVAVDVWVHIRPTRESTAVHETQVIVVTPAYRLNVFGFFTTLDGSAPGNFGLLDQVASLDWVQQQIRDFGGDPDKVVIGGHGAGAVSVGLHLVSPLSSGKFSAALQMSGAALMTSVIKTHPRGLIAEISENFGCEEIMSCVRKISPLILLIQTVSAADWGPVVDGLYANNSATAFLPAHPSQLFEEERFSKVPLMAGYTDMEEALDFTKRDTSENDFDKDSFDTLIGDSALDGVPEPEDNETCILDKTFVRDSVSFFYNSEPQSADGIVLKQKYMYYKTEKNYGSSILNQSSYVSKFKQVFIYRFDYRMKTTGVLDLQDWMTAPQYGEIPFVFGMPYWTSISSQIVWNSADKKVADSVMSLWGNFTKYFRPAQQGRSIRWDPFNPEAPSVMILDKVFNMSDPTTINYKALSFWNDYFPKVVRIATQCCNMTNHSSKIHNGYSYRLFSVWTVYTVVAILL